MVIVYSNCETTWDESYIPTKANGYPACDGAEVSG
jgi:hypothetical protein